MAWQVALGIVARLHARAAHRLRGVGATDDAAPAGFLGQVSRGSRRRP